MPHKNEQYHINNATSVLKEGGIIALPTDTVYGLAADAFNEVAVEKISLLKKRENTKNYVLQIDSINKLTQLVDEVNNLTKGILENYWPGEITFIFKTNPNLKLSYIQETIAIRIPNNPLTLALLKEYPNPLVVTSLNYSGQPPITTFSDIPDSLRNELDYAIPFNEALSGLSSTIVDLTKTPPTLLRQGKVKFQINLH